MGKIVNFFREVKTEMLKVVWPTRTDVLKYTIAVIAFSVAIAVILGAADYGLLKGFEKILE